jgi:hypothetical protein
MNTNKFKVGDPIVMRGVVIENDGSNTYPYLIKIAELYALTTAGIFLKIELIPCVDAVDRIPSLGEQEEMVKGHLRVEPTPTREQVLLSNIDSNERRIESEWSKSEPNLDRINMLSRFINENKLELKNIQSVKN